MLKAGIALILLLGPATAGAQEWRTAREVELRLSGRDIEPAILRLAAGEPVRLRLVNSAAQARTVSARDFFASARLRSRDAAAMAGGRITVAAGEARELRLVPAPGRYRIRSANLLYRLLGMSGEIVVE